MLSDANRVNNVLRTILREAVARRVTAASSSAGDSGGRIDGRRAASIDLPLPGEPIIKILWTINQELKGTPVKKKSDEAGGCGGGGINSFRAKKDEIDWVPMIGA